MSSEPRQAACGPDQPAWYRRSLEKLDEREERLNFRRQLIDKRRELARAEAALRQQLQGDASNLAQSFCRDVLGLPERGSRAEFPSIAERYRGRFDAVFTTDQVRKMFQNPGGAETMDRRAKTADEYRVGYCYMVGPRPEGRTPSRGRAPTDDEERPEVGPR